GDTDDLAFIHGGQRTQYQHVRRAVDHAKVDESLAGHLRDTFTGNQRGNLQRFRHLLCSAEHHALEHHAHVGIVDLLQNLAHHIFKRHSDKLHAMGSAVLVPQVVSHFLHTDFVGTPAEIEETVMRTQAALDAQISRDGG